MTYDKMGQTWKTIILKAFVCFVFFLQNYNAKISDFGLAKLGPSGGESHVTTRVMGTYGYAAPEYVATGKYESFFVKMFRELNHRNYSQKTSSMNKHMRGKGSCLYVLFGR